MLAGPTHNGPGYTIGHLKSLYFELRLRVALHLLITDE